MKAAQLLAVGIILVGCAATVSESPSLSPTTAESEAATTTAGETASSNAPDSPSADPSAGTPGTEPSDTPAGLPFGRFAFNQRLAVTADGLAVRRSPTTSAELAFGAPWDASAGDWVGTTEAVRLPAGYQVLVWLGPIERDGLAWYEVRNVEGPGTEADVVQWDVDNDGIYGDTGWIAAGNDEDTFVEAVSAAADAPNPPLVFAAGSSGTFLSDPFYASGDVGGTWALVTDDLAPCDFTVTLEPSDEPLVTASLIGVFEYGSVGLTGLAGEYRLRVAAGVAGSPDAACNWALALFQSVS
jgi:hypothetical protein